MSARAERVISLLPGGTEIVAALGALESLVAVSHECDYPREVLLLPRVTASGIDRNANSAQIDADVRERSRSGLPLFALNAADVVLLAPSVIITQTLCDVCAVGAGDVRDIAEVLTRAPVIVPMTGTTLDGVWDDIRKVGAALGRSEQAESLLVSIAARMGRVHDALAAARAPRPRVAVIEWLNPIFAAGHWTPELVRRAGGIDVLAQPGAHSERVDVQQIRDAAPELLLFAPCGFDVDRAACEAEMLLSTDAWAWARDIEAWAIDGNALTSRPGPRLADAIEVIASIVAPGLFAAPAHSYARRLQLLASDLRS